MPARKNTTKTAADIAISNWRTVAYVMPAGPISYETKNIAWMTRVTGRSMSQPIVAGDRIFFGSAYTDLMCVNKADGKVLWIRSNTPWDALSTEERAQYKDRIEPLAIQLEKLNDEAVAAINAMASPAGIVIRSAGRHGQTAEGKTGTGIEKSTRNSSRRSTVRGVSP